MKDGSDVHIVKHSSLSVRSIKLAVVAAALMASLFSLLLNSVAFADVLTATRAGTGSGVISGEGLVCSGSACTAVYSQTVGVLLAASPDSGSRFTGWSGACKHTENTCSIIMDSDQTVTAYFSPANVPTFGDVPLDYWAGSFIDAMVNNGITSGCGGGNFCPEASVTRAQMAVFLLKAVGEPPADTCTGSVFSDVSGSLMSDTFCRYIEKFSSMGITSGCGNGNFCPDSPVTRAQMAVFITKAMGQTPSSCAGTVFGDVSQAMNGGAGFCSYIEKFKELNITSGCGSGNYCPDSVVTRAQMSVFLTRGFLESADQNAGTVLPGAGQPDTPISDEERLNAFHEISVKLASIKNLPDDQLHEEIGRYLASRPEFEAAGFGVGGAWGRFTDGRLVVFDDNEVYPTAPPASQPAGLAPQTASASIAPAASSWMDIPTASHICLYSSVGTSLWMWYFKHFVDTTQCDGDPCFAYTADDAQNNATVEAMKHISTDCAVIGLDAHGSDMALSRSLKRIYSVYTSTPLSLSSEVEYWDLLSTEQLAYYHPLKPISSLDIIIGADSLYHYAFTAKFAQNFWAATHRFDSTKPFVYFNTCRGYNKVSRPIIDAVFSAGASLYAGWTYRSFGEDGNRTATYVFDRLLGSNGFQETWDKKHRPFGWDVLGEEMKSHHLGRTPDDKYGTKAAPDSLLVFEPAPSSPFKLLAPSLKYMEVDEKVDSANKPELTLFGTFGSTPGDVLLINDFGRSSLSVISWERNKIVCSLDTGDTGDVAVRVNGSWSNLRRLSKWEGKAHFTAAAPHPNSYYPQQLSCNLKDEVTWDLKLRADVDTYREIPGRDPIDRDVKWLPTKESSTIFSSSGSQVFSTDNGPFTWVIWSGGGAIDVNNPKDESISHVWYSVNTGTKLGKMDILFLGKIGTKTVTYNPGTPGQQVSPQAINMTDPALAKLYDERDTYKANYITYMPFDGSWNIPQGNKQVNAQQYGAVMNVPVTLKWDAMPVNYPPVTDDFHGK